MALLQCDGYNATGELDLLPCEQELIDGITAFNNTQDPMIGGDTMKAYQKTFTENVNAAGLTACLDALIINKRFANIPAWAPIFMYTGP